MGDGLDPTPYRESGYAAHLPPPYLGNIIPGRWVRELELSGVTRHVVKTSSQNLVLSVKLVSQVRAMPY